VIQLWGIGETILTLPAIKALQKRFLYCKIDILCTKRNSLVYADVGGNVSVKEISTNPFSIKLFMMRNFKKYDLVIDMEEYLNISAIIGSAVGKYRLGYAHGVRAKTYHRTVVYNDKQHTSETFMDLIRAIGVKGKIERLPKVGYSSNDEKNVDAILKEKGISKNDVLVCLAVGAAESAKSRMWPLEKYTQLSNKLLEMEVKLIFTGTSEESSLIQQVIGNINSKEKVIDLSGKLTLPQLFCFMKKPSLFIGNDSGPMHIAAAQGIPTIGLFGPNLPLRFGPVGEGNVGIYKRGVCEFSPCINVHKGKVPDCLYSKTSSDYQKCMKAISVDGVLSQARRLLK
jgi:heptosyltransferase-2